MMGHINYPEAVITDFRLANENDISKLWFQLMENDLIFKYVILPELKPIALQKSIKAFVTHKEIRECAISLTYCYFEYLCTDNAEVQKIGNFHKFLEMEYAIYQEEDEAKELCKKRRSLYLWITEWLEKCLDNPDELLKNQKLIRMLFEIIILSRSNILKDPGFQGFFTQHKAELRPILE